MFIELLYLILFVIKARLKLLSLRQKNPSSTKSEVDCYKSSFKAAFSAPEESKFH
jgi:hypothetical protein